LKFALAHWNSNYKTLKRLAQKAEALNFDAFYYGEGLGIETFTALAALSQVTERIRIGPGICFVTYRHPGVLAKIVSALDEISDGRVDLRLGAGGAPGYGIEKPPALVRVEQLNEALEIMKNLWLKGCYSFFGKYYQIKDAVCEPPCQKPHPPIVIAAKGKKMLKLVSRHADVWEGYYPPDVFKRLQNAQLAGIKKSALLRVFIDETREKALKWVEKYVTQKGESKARIQALLERDAVGSPEDCIEKIKEYLKVGIESFTLVFPQISLNFEEALEIFSKSVINCI
jgi:alkanesulfonate monooxygenase SsuD/methylene tetrahydromethanopterin reductase-like flavin-dependent oxidoreductase (luciferase family)